MRWREDTEGDVKAPNHLLSTCETTKINLPSPQQEVSSPTPGARSGRQRCYSTPGEVEGAVGRSPAAEPTHQRTQDHVETNGVHVPAQCQNQGPLKSQQPWVGPVLTAQQARHPDDSSAALSTRHRRGSLRMPWRTFCFLQHPPARLVQ